MGHCEKDIDRRCSLDPEYGSVRRLDRIDPIQLSFDRDLRNMPAQPLNLLDVPQVSTGKAPHPDNRYSDWPHLASLCRREIALMQFIGS